LVEYSDQKKLQANGRHFQIGRQQNRQNFNVLWFQWKLISIFCFKRGPNRSEVYKRNVCINYFLISTRLSNSITTGTLIMPWILIWGSFENFCVCIQTQSNLVIIRLRLGTSDSSHISTHRHVQHIPRWWIRDALSMVAWQYHDTECLIMDHSGFHVWLLPQSLYVENHSYRFKQKYEWVSDCYLRPTHQFFSYIMVRTS
jgi:hypothetical protein